MIKLPFIQHRGIGLHITGQSVRWVEIQRIKDTLRVKAIDKEYIRGSREEAIQQLVERQQPSLPFVSVNISLNEITYRLLNAPGSDEEEIFDSWIEKQYDDIIPDGGNPSEFIVRHQVLRHEEDSVKCFIAAVKEKDVENINEVLETAGLKPLYIGTGILEMAYGLILSEEFVEGEKNIGRVFKDGSFLAKYKKGLLFDLSELRPDKSSEPVFPDDSMMQSASLPNHRGKNPSTTYLMKSDDPEYGSFDPETIKGNKKEEIIPAEDLISFGGEEIDGDLMIALGLAVKQVYPALDDVNFNEPPKIKSYKEEIEKKDAFHLGIGLAAFFISILLITSLFKFYSEYKLSNIEMVASDMEDQITTVEAAMDKLESERLQLTQVQRLVQDRNYFAPSLQAIGTEMPENAWFSEVLMQTESEKNSIEVRGYSSSELGMAKFMENLENRDDINEVILKKSERNRTDRIYPDEYVPEGQIFTFELQFKYSNLE